MSNLTKSGSKIYGMFTSELQDEFKSEFISQLGESKFNDFLKRKFKGGITEFAMSCFDFGKSPRGADYWLEKTADLTMSVREDAKFTLVLATLAERMSPSLAMILLIEADRDVNEIISDESVLEQIKEDKRYLTENWVKIDKSKRIKEVKTGAEFLKMLPVDVQNNFIAELTSQRGNVKKEYLEDQYDSMDSFLKCGFVFVDSDKGYKYWREIVTQFADANK